MNYETIKSDIVRKIKFRFLHFPIYKWEYLFKIKEIEELRGGVVRYAAQAISKIDADIGQIGHL